nr:hypothetical protein [uncultured Rhodoferax sp.]
MSNKETGGPAFPGLNAQMTGIDSEGTERWETEPSGGMTLRQYAAIKLKVPDSGDDWLDAMIVKSLRDDFAAKAMQSFLVNQPPHATDMTYPEWASDSYQMADAMLETCK